MIEKARPSVSLTCSFCGKTSREVQHMVAGPTVNICDECVRLSADIIGYGWADEGGTKLEEVSGVRAELAKAQSAMVDAEAEIESMASARDAAVCNAERALATAARDAAALVALLQEALPVMAGENFKEEGPALAQRRVWVAAVRAAATENT